MWNENKEKEAENGPFLKKNNLPKSSTFLGNICKGVKIYHFPSEIIFGQLL